MGLDLCSYVFRFGLFSFGYMISRMGTLPLCYSDAHRVITRLPMYFVSCRIYSKRDSAWSGCQALEGMIRHHELLARLLVLYDVSTEK
jgi:hypothetical protein